MNRKFFGIGVVLVLALVVGACAPAVEPAVEEPVVEEPVAEMEPSIAEIAAGNPDFSTLVVALDAAGLVETFSGEGEFTVFAPTNAAFEAALSDLGITTEELLSNKELLTQILQYHVVPGVVTSDVVVTLSEAETLLGEKVAITVMDGDVYLNETVKVSAVDIMASNGVIHVIDYVLLPEAAMPKSIAEIASGNADLSTLVAALDAAGLVENFSGEGAFTVFAPTNAAFDAAFAALGITAEELLADSETLTSILTYHVVGEVLTAEDVLSRNLLFTLNGAPALAYANEMGAYIQNAMIVQTDIAASNGIIHVIDAVILPPTFATDATDDVVTTAVNNGSFTILATALQSAGLVDVLQGNGPFTVFAPTDDAFAAALADLGITAEELLADTELLTNILLYHVTVGALDSAAVIASESIPMANGEMAPVDVEALTVGGAALNAGLLDIAASNGIIHVLDYVMLPPQ